jgi:hypothetical protein
VPDEPFTPTTGQYETDKMVRDWLRKPFKPEQIGKLPATSKRPALDFVGHAAVTDRLNKIAPGWSYTIDERWDGLSAEYAKGVEVQVPTFWVRGTMTIGGVSRAEFGDGKDAKEAIGNFIRRGAMRFGVAIDLWSREELESAPAMGASADAGGRVDTESSASRDSSRDEYCRTRGCGHIERLHTPDCHGLIGSHNDPEGSTEGPCRCKAFISSGSDKPGVIAGTSGDSPAPSEGTTEVQGEGTSDPSASPESGGAPGGDSLPPARASKYPADPLTCDHKFGTGAPAKVKIRGKELCRLCGTPWVSAVEGTTADLGAA